MQQFCIALGLHVFVFLRGGGGVGGGGGGRESYYDLFANYCDFNCYDKKGKKN